MRGRRAIVWLTPGQIQLARQAAHAAELEMVGAGSPERGRSAGVAAGLGAGEAFDDLRATVASREADLFWILSPGPFGSGPEDAAALVAAHERGARVVTLEPIPALTADLGTRAWTGGLSRAADVPILAPAWEGPPAEVLAGLGRARTMALEWWSGPGEGSLAARLATSMELTLRIMGEPETIDSAYAGAEHGRGVHALPGESLRGLSGDLTANLRFAEGRAASLALSDRACAWGRSLSVLGPGGRVHMRDDEFTWLGPDGNAVEEPETGARRTKGKRAIAVDTAARAMGRALTLARSERRTVGRAVDPVTVLAMCHAALLSARTGQGESPATIKRIAGFA